MPIQCKRISHETIVRWLSRAWQRLLARRLAAECCHILLETVGGPRYRAISCHGYEHRMTSQIAESLPLILTYHSISSGPPPLSVSPQLFKEQIEWLKDNAEVVPFSRLVDAITGGFSLAPRTIAITFDDGYADFYHYAAPVLRRAQFSATVFLPTQFCARTSSWAGQSDEMNRQPIFVLSASTRARATVHHLRFPYGVTRGINSVVAIRYRTRDYSQQDRNRRVYRDASSFASSVIHLGVTMPQFETSSPGTTAQPARRF